MLYTHVLSCSSHFLWHLPPRGVLKIFGLVIVWGYLQQPLVLNFNRLGSEEGSEEGRRKGEGREKEGRRKGGRREEEGKRKGGGREKEGGNEVRKGRREEKER